MHNETLESFSNKTYTLIHNLKQAVISFAIKNRRSLWTSRCTMPI